MTTPNWPGNYPANQDCLYQITVEEGKKLLLQFVTFNFESSRCAFDYIQVFDGLTSSSPMILDKRCGNIIPPPVRASGNSLTVRFVSDDADFFTGFRAEYYAYDEFPSPTTTQPTTPGNGCSHYGGDSGYVTSPNHPDPYTNNLEICYTITTATNTVVRLTFEAFEIEQDSACSYDYLEIYGGPGTSSNYFKLCGENRLPSPIDITGNIVNVKFTSDGSVGRGGFKIKYEAIDEATTQSPTQSPTPISTQPPSQETQPPTQTSTQSPTQPSTQQPTQPTTQPPTAQPTQPATCGGDFDESNSLIRSPDWPSNYPSSQDCLYRITVEPGKLVKVTFTDFTLEGFGCRYDYLSAYDGLTETSTAIGAKRCGSTIPQPIESTGNTMLLQFKSDNSDNFRGFRAEVTAFTMASVCNVFTAETGAITSPNYPSNYPNNAKECYLIQQPTDKIVKLTFVDFELEGNAPACLYDNVKIYDGSTASQATELVTQCDVTLPGLVRTSGNQMLITFTSDRDLTRKGFNLTYAASNKDCTVRPSVILNSLAP